MLYQNKRGPGSEWEIQETIRKELHNQGWKTIKMHGNAYQKGLPDLLCLHKIYGQRWVEIKKPNEKLSATQVKTFHEFHSCGIPIYVLTSLFDVMMIIKGEANWQRFIRW